MKRNRQLSRRRGKLNSRIVVTEREIAADLHFPASAKAPHRLGAQAK